jgi:hypothetical protein
MILSLADEIGTGQCSVGAGFQLPAVTAREKCQ